MTGSGKTLAFALPVIEKLLKSMMGKKNVLIDKIDLLLGLGKRAYEADLNSGGSLFSKQFFDLVSFQNLAL